MRVYVTRRLPAGVTVESVAAEHGMGPADLDMATWQQDRRVDDDVLRREAARADGLLCMLEDRIDDALLAAAPQLRVVSQMAVGVDNIDLEAARRRGIPVGHTPGVLVDATADLAFALILAAARRVGEAERFLRAGRWTQWGPDLLLGKELSGSTLGIVGMGAIGQAVARRALGFGMQVLYSSRTDKDVPDATLVPLEELLSKADVVSVHVALTPETRGLIGASQIALMKPDAILVNTARGPVVDEEALADALADRRIAAAGLDVFAAEPIPADSRLLTLENVVLVPHIGSATTVTRRRMAEIAVKNLLAGLLGEPLLHRAV